jgi:hypothetical protein
MSDVLEQVRECINVGINTFGRLVYLDVRKTQTKVLDNGTYYQ